MSRSAALSSCQKEFPLRSGRTKVCHSKDSTWHMSLYSGHCFPLSETSSPKSVRESTFLRPAKAIRCQDFRVRSLCESTPVERCLYYSRATISTVQREDLFVSDLWVVCRTCNAVFRPKFPIPRWTCYSFYVFVQPQLKCSEIQKADLSSQIQARGIDPVTSHLVVARLRDNVVLSDAADLAKSRTV